MSCKDISLHTQGVLNDLQKHISNRFLKESWFIVVHVAFILSVWPLVLSVQQNIKLPGTQNIRKMWAPIKMFKYLLIYIYIEYSYRTVVGCKKYWFTIYTCSFSEKFKKWKHNKWFYTNLFFSIWYINTVVLLWIKHAQCCWLIARFQRD